MSDAKKLADYDRIVQIVREEIALEKHMRERNVGPDGIEFIRADAYEHIVDLVA